MTLGPCVWCGSQDRVNIYSYEELEENPIPHIVHIITELCEPCKTAHKVMVELCGEVTHPWHDDLATLMTSFEYQGDKSRLKPLFKDGGET